MFLIREASNNATIQALVPSPTEVEYPEGRHLEKLDTIDGYIVLQRPPNDPRVHRWAWKAYTRNVPGYNSLWTTIQAYETKTRLDASKDGWVEIWEDDSQEKTFGQTTDGLDPDLVAYSNLEWTKVRFFQVYRKTRKGGGRAVYEDTIMEFVLAPQG